MRFFRFAFTLVLLNLVTQTSCGLRDYLKEREARAAAQRQELMNKESYAVYSDLIRELYADKNGLLLINRSTFRGNIEGLTDEQLLKAMNTTYPRWIKEVQDFRDVRNGTFESYRIRNQQTEELRDQFNSQISYKWFEKEKADSNTWSRLRSGWTSLTFSRVGFDDDLWQALVSVKKEDAEMISDYTGGEEGRLFFMQKTQGVWKVQGYMIFMGQ